MNKSKLISVFALFMLILNIGLLAFVFFARPHPKKHEGPKDIIIERLEFDNTQINEYEILIEKHQKDIVEINDYIKGLKAELFEYLSEEDSSSSASILSVIGEKQMQKEQIHFNHFLDLKELCREDQMDNFLLLESDLVNLFDHKKPK